MVFIYAEDDLAVEFVVKKHGITDYKAFIDGKYSEGLRWPKGSRVLVRLGLDDRVNDHIYRQRRYYPDVPVEVA